MWKVPSSSSPQPVFSESCWGGGGGLLVANGRTGVVHFGLAKCLFLLFVLIPTVVDQQPLPFSSGTCHCEMHVSKVQKRQ